MARQASLSAQENDKLQLAVNEACTNSIKHAYAMAKGHSIMLSADIDNRRIRLSIKDFGTKPDLQSYQEPDLDNPRETGYGIYLLRHIMDELYFDVSHDLGTEVIMIKHRQ